MTPQEHNKYLGISHLAYGGLMCLLCLAIMGLFIGVLSSAPGGPPVGVMLFMTIFIGALYALMTVPSLVAGYGLLKRRSWARTASIIGAVTAAMNFPIGTAVCVYTFWFLFSEPGRLVFDKRDYMLPPGRQAWANETHQREPESVYTPPPTPPDWR